MITII